MQLTIVPELADGERPETGPMQFGNDWPGVFIRGDHALAAAAHLERAIKLVEKMSSAYWPTMSVLTGLLEELKSCDAKLWPAQKPTEGAL
jgi:hypothetical protein